MPFSPCYYRHTPLLTERLRSKRRGKVGRSWHCDETYVKVAGRWCYLYRAIDRDRYLADPMTAKLAATASLRGGVRSGSLNLPSPI